MTLRSQFVLAFGGYDGRANSSDVLIFFGDRPELGACKLPVSGDIPPARNGHAGVEAGDCGEASRSRAHGHVIAMRPLQFSWSAVGLGAEFTLIRRCTDWRYVS